MAYATAGRFSPGPVGDARLFFGCGADPALFAASASWRSLVAVSSACMDSEPPRYRTMSDAAHSVNRRAASPGTRGMMYTTSAIFATGVSVPPRPPKLWSTTFSVTCVQGFSVS